MSLLNVSDFRRHTFFVLNRLIGSRCGECYRKMFEWEKLDKNELEYRQRKRLKAILHHAVVRVPYYRKHVSQTKDLSLESFPILTRLDVRTNFHDLMTDQLRCEYDGKIPRQHRYSWVEVKTGGSTGMPTKVIHDGDFRDFDRASRLYTMYMCGFPFGTPYFRLWGSMREINQMKDSLYHRLLGWFAREKILNAFRMELTDMNHYIDQINRSDIKHIMAYVDAAYQIALYSRRQGIQLKAIKSVMACAGTVTDTARETIVKAFHTHVHNKYGSRDCGDIACECDKGNIHIFANWYIVEVVDEKGKQVPTGENGRLLITILGNYGFPMIRYEIGDIGAISNKSCSCGRRFPLLKRIEGRSIEFLQSTSGGYISPAYIIHLIGVVHNPGSLKRFQLVQDHPNKFSLKLQWEAESSSDSIDRAVTAIIRDLKTVIGLDAEIKVSHVSNIPETASGKFLYTINHVHSPSNDNIVHM